METERLSDIKKELKSLGSPELIEICVKLAKFKKENKELLSYLLFNASDPVGYIDSVKISLQTNFHDLPPNEYQKIKALRKTLRILNKHIRFIGSPEAEVELLLWYCENFLQHSSIRSSRKALIVILTRQLQKIHRQIKKLHEDLQFDYKQEYNLLVDATSHRIRDFNPGEFRL